MNVRWLVVSRGFLVVVVVGSIACTADPPAVQAAASTVGCSGPGCNENSPVIAGVPFFELERSGQPNEQGFKITGFRSHAGVPYRIDVQQAQLVGLDSLGRVALRDAAVLGSVISLRDPSGASWEIDVSDAASMQFWADPTGPATTYELRVHPPANGEWENLCKRPPSAGDWPGIVTHAILFEGDRYRPIEKEVSAIGPAAAGWFNIACAGTATAKMHLTRHNEAGANPAHPTDWKQRQAMLRAFTATVCPGSDSFTGMGEKLQPVDVTKLLPEPNDLSHLEGLWNQDGAICLGEPRLYDPNSMSKEEAKDLLAKLPIQCPNVPSCDTFKELPTGWRQSGMVLTLNP